MDKNYVLHRLNATQNCAVDSAVRISSEAIDSNTNNGSY